MAFPAQRMESDFLGCFFFRATLLLRRTWGPEISRTLGAAKNVFLDEIRDFTLSELLCSLTAAVQSASSTPDKQISVSNIHTDQAPLLHKF